jgi:Ca2+/Na+ antiporter
MKLFEESTLDSKTLFFYVVIIITIIFSFSTINLNLNILYGTIIAYFLINYLYSDYKQKQEKENKTKSYQEANLLPKPEIISKYGDIIKYLFSIQDLYIYNPQAYEEITDSLANFFRTFEETQNNPCQAGINHGLMITYKKHTVNALHSIIYNLSNDVDYTEKLNEAIVILQEILDEYLDKVEKKQKECLYEYGYNVSTKLINKGELAYNEFSDNNYEIF